MDIALVTGAHRSVGLKISQTLIQQGYKVYGLAQDFSKCHFQHKDFVPVTCDLTSQAALESAWDQIYERDSMVCCMAFAEQHEPAESFEATRPEEIAYTLHTGLLAPMVLTRLALPSLMRLHGYVLNVAWHAQGAGPLNAAAAATQAGLFHFGQSLFEDLRDTGVKVCTFTPQRNLGNADPKGRLRLQPQSEVDPALIAEAVESVLKFKGHNAISQVVIRPQGQREDPIIPTSIPELTRAKHEVILPPEDKKPPEPEMIPTPKPQRPADAPPPGEADEEEEADDDLDQMLEESRALLKEQRDLARKKVAKEKDRLEREALTQEEKPRFIPLEPEKPEHHEPTEEELKEAEEARKRFAALLGFDEPEDDSDRPFREPFAADEGASEDDPDGILQPDEDEDEDYEDEDFDDQDEDDDDEDEDFDDQDEDDVDEDDDEDDDEDEEDSLRNEGASDTTEKAERPLAQGPRKAFAKKRAQKKHGHRKQPRRKPRPKGE